MSVSLLCYIFGMLVVSVAQAYLVFFVGLALAGVGVGVGLAANTMYFTEIVPKDIRGQFVVLEEVSILLASGWFFYCLQYEWSWSEGWNFACWRAVGFCSIIAPLVVLILLNTGFVLESPRYLMTVGREDEGKELLIRLVGREEASVALADWVRRGGVVGDVVAGDLGPNAVAEVTDGGDGMDSGDGGSHTSLIDGPMVRLSCANTLSYSRVLGSAKSRGKWLYEPDAEIEFSATEFGANKMDQAVLMLQRAQTRKPRRVLVFLSLGAGLWSPGRCVLWACCWRSVCLVFFFFPACAVCGPIFPFCLPFG